MKLFRLLFLMVFLCTTTFVQGQGNQHQSNSNSSATDSLKKVNMGAPVAPYSDTLFTIYERIGSFSAKERAVAVTGRIKSVGDDYGYHPDSIKIDDHDNAVDIKYGDIIIFSVTPKDVANTGLSVEQTAEKRREEIIEAIQKHKDATSLLATLKHLGLVLAILVALYFVLKYTNRLFKYFGRKVVMLKGKKIKGISIKSYSILDADKETKLIVFLINILRYIAIAIILYFGVLSLFKVFPATEPLADKLFGYFLNPIQKIFRGIVAYIPNLFTIIVIYIVFRYLIKGVRYAANEIANGSIKINGFYPDWAKPTFNIVRVLLYAFMFIFIFPYLPGSESGVFQGVSVFLGIIVSLGSTSLIGNLVAGFVLTYMRSFKKGDRVKIGEIVGNVVEKTPFVIRVRTPKNEEITIPNSTIMSAHTINYTSSAQEYGLIIYSTITMGYEIPWQQVHELLIEAALKTPKIMEEPKPFVLQTALDDSYVKYQINAYTKSENDMPRIYSDLYRNVLDIFGKAGIEVMSPLYYAQRDGNKSTVPPQADGNTIEMHG